MDHHALMSEWPNLSTSDLQAWLAKRMPPKSCVMQWMIHATTLPFASKDQAWWETWLAYNQSLDDRWHEVDLVCGVIKNTLRYLPPHHALWGCLQKRCPSKTSPEDQKSLIGLFRDIAKHRRADCVQAYMATNALNPIQALQMCWGVGDVVEELLKHSPQDDNLGEHLKNFMCLTLNAHPKKEQSGQSSSALDLPASLVSYLTPLQRKSVALAALVANHKTMHQAVLKQDPSIGFRDEEIFEAFVLAEREDAFALFPHCRLALTDYQTFWGKALIRQVIFKSSPSFAQNFFDHHPDHIPHVFGLVPPSRSKCPIHNKRVFVQASWEVQNKHIQHASTIGDGVASAWRLARWSSHEPSSFKVDFVLKDDHDRWQQLISRQSRRWLTRAINPSSSTPLVRSPRIL